MGVMHQQHSTIHPDDNEFVSTPRHRRTALGIAGGIVATLVAGVAFAATTTSAAPTPGESTFVPIEPCRLMDSRPEFQVGERNSPIGADETHTISLFGANGNCELPTDISGVALNATALNATLPSFATFFPAGSDRPLSSNLNYVPGQPPTPNKVDVKLSSGGELSVFNAYGEVDLVIDVTGYYETAGLTRIASRLDELDRGHGELGESVELFHQDAIDHRPRNYVRQSEGISNVGDSPVEVAKLVVQPLASGRVVVNSSTLASSAAPGAELRCSLSSSPELDAEALQVWQAAGPDAPYLGQLAGTRAFQVAEGDEITIRLVCQRVGAVAVNIANAHLTATFVAQPILELT